MHRLDALNQAKALIDGDRAAQYGGAHDTHERIAKMWDAVLGPSGLPLNAHDVALMMICVKIIRATKSPAYEDSWVDIAGYAALGCEMASALAADEEPA